MTGLLLATLLNLSPGIQLADNVAARNVALSEARFAFRNVDYDEDEAKPSLDAMTRDQLAVELRRLDDTRPSLVGPIVMLSIGVALSVPGIALILSGLSEIASSTYSLVLGTMIIVFGSAVLITGVILALVGGIKLATRFGARAAHAQETDEIRKRIDAMDQTIPPQPPPPPPGPDSVPPPPPPPPQANFVIPGAMQTVMTF